MKVTLYGNVEKKIECEKVELISIYPEVQMVCYGVNGTKTNEGMSLIAFEKVTIRP